ncbi:MAG: hypothetical protein HY020_25000 [Burkholderiales bacterium]|nr:hypothetical protein [Burkholderiales bacterium]
MQNGNGPVRFPSGIFSSNFTAVDLNADGTPDPDWIRLGSWAPGGANGVFTPATINGKSIIGNWFSATVSPNSNSLAGTWSLTLPNNIQDIVGPVSARICLTTLRCPSRAAIRLRPTISARANWACR